MGTILDPEPVDDRDSPEAGEPAAESWRDTARSWATYGHTGLMFPVATALGALAGNALDGWLGTGPWMALLGGAFGIAAAVRNLFRTVAIQEQRERAARARRVEQMRRQRRHGGDDDGDRDGRDRPFR